MTDKQKRLSEIRDKFAESYSVNNVWVPDEHRVIDRNIRHCKAGFDAGVTEMKKRAEILELGLGHSYNYTLEILKEIPTIHEYNPEEYFHKRIYQASQILTGALEAYRKATE